MEFIIHSRAHTQCVAHVVHVTCMRVFFLLFFFFVSLFLICRLVSSLSICSEKKKKITLRKKIKSNKN